MDNFFDMLLKEASKNRTVEEIQLISEALFLFKNSLKVYQNVDIQLINRLINYRTFRYLRQTGSRDTDIITWTSIYKAFNRLKEMYENY